jgi:hypothetical protein
MAMRFGHVAFQLLDKLGVVVSMPIYLDFDDSKTLTAIIGEMSDYAAALDTATDSQITAVTINVTIPVPGGVKSAPADTAENERTGLFNFAQSGLPYRYGVDVPAIIADSIVDGKIDLSNGNITGFYGQFTTPGINTTPVSTSDKTLTAIKDVLLTFRKHRKAENRRSFEEVS